MASVSPFAEGGGSGKPQFQKSLAKLANRALFSWLSLPSWPAGAVAEQQRRRPWKLSKFYDFWLKKKLLRVLLTQMEMQESAKGLLGLFGLSEQVSSSLPIVS